MSGSTATRAKQIIFLWSTRRVLSTPLHRAIFQLDGIKHFCEPFSLPWYFGPDRISVQFKNRQHIADTWDRIPTFAEGLANITKDYSSEGYDKVFIKEHAMYAYPDKVPDDILCSAVNSFIIRNPTKAIKSLYRIWDKFVVDEVGYKEQWLWYDKIANTLKQPVIVIDADDLMANPRDILMKYSEFAGVEFDDKMLDWSNDKDKEDAPWNFIPLSWVRDVKETTGFREKDKVHDEGVEYPPFVQETIDANMKWYEQLYSKRLVL